MNVDYFDIMYLTSVATVFIGMVKDESDTFSTGMILVVLVTLCSAL